MRRRQEDQWVPALYRAMQAAIGQLLKTEYENPPTELTPELHFILARIEEQKGEQDKPVQLPTSL